jgi:hypothetical protein
MVYVIAPTSRRLGDQDIYVSAARDIETILIAGRKGTEVRTSRPANHIRSRPAIFQARMQAGRSCSLAKFRLSETIHYNLRGRRLASEQNSLARVYLPTRGKLHVSSFVPKPRR